MRNYILSTFLIAILTGVHGFLAFDLPATEFIPILFLIAANLVLISLLGKLLITKRDDIDRLKPVRIK